jgi:hypothetical protein
MKKLCTLIIAIFAMTFATSANAFNYKVEVLGNFSSTSQSGEAVSDPKRCVTLMLTNPNEGTTDATTAIPVTLQIQSDGTFTTATGSVDADYSGWIVKAESPDCFLCNENGKGIASVIVGDNNELDINLQKQECRSYVEKLSATNTGQIRVSFTNHKLDVANGESFTARLTYVGQSSDFNKPAVKSATSSTAETFYVTGKQDGDDLILTRIFGADDWYLTVPDGSRYILNIDKASIKIDEYSYDYYDLELTTDIETGVFNVVEQGDAVVDVYTPAGLKVKTQVLESTLQEQLPAGVYIIRGAQKTYKLMLE